MKNIQKALALLSLYSLPIVFIEIFAQFRYSHSLGERAYISKIFNSEAKSIYGLHKPNTASELKYRYLYDWQDDDTVKTSIFRTDKYGTVVPSSFESVRKNSSTYTLFCGGSTTECSFVQEGLRVPDVYAKTSRMPAVNAGVSGKDVYGCINTISFFLSRTPKPSNIVIANNVNTLMTFGNSLIKAESPSPINVTKNTLSNVLPGMHQLAISVKAKLARKQGVNNVNPEFSDYENALDNGCCHGASSFNRQKPQIDWNDNNVKRAYLKYVETASNQLSKILTKSNVDKSIVYVFIEPNSFGLKGTSSKKDWRQTLTAKDGRKLGNQDSGLITEEYDEIYKLAFEKSGYKVIAIQSEQLSPNDFYDAVHLTPSGSTKIGKFYAYTIKPQAIQ